MTNERYWRGNAVDVEISRKLSLVANFWGVCPECGYPKVSLELDSKENVVLAKHAGWAGLGEICFGSGKFPKTTSPKS